MVVINFDELEMEWQICKNGNNPKQKNVPANFIINFCLKVISMLQALQEISVEDRKRQLDNCKVELTSIDSRRDIVSTNLKDTEKKLSELMKKQRSANSELDKWRTQEKEAQEALEEDARSLDKMATKQNMLQKKIDECTAKICDLGSLPSDFFDKYQNMGSKNVT